MQIGLAWMLFRVHARRWFWNLGADRWVSWAYRWTRADVELYRVQAQERRARRIADKEAVNHG